MCNCFFSAVSRSKRACSEILDVMEIWHLHKNGSFSWNRRGCLVVSGSAFCQSDTQHFRHYFVIHWNLCDRQAVESFWKLCHDLTDFIELVKFCFQVEDHSMQLEIRCFKAGAVQICVKFPAKIFVFFSILYFSPPAWSAILFVRTLPSFKFWTPSWLGSDGSPNCQATLLGGDFLVFGVGISVASVFGFWKCQVCWREFQWAEQRLKF